MDNDKLKTRTRQGAYIIKPQRGELMFRLTSQETMLLAVVAKEGENAYRRCMEVNK